MDNNNVMFKRVKINRWTVVASLVVIFTWILLYIIFKKSWSLIALPAFIFLLELRYIFSVDDNFVIFKKVSNLFEISISDIENVEVKQEPLNFLFFFKFYQFDLLEKEVVSMKLKSGKTYEIRIKNAQEIKEEIEKRMIKPI